MTPTVPRTKAPRSPRNVLVVDDTKSIRQHIAQLLRQRCDAVVTEAEHGVQALQCLKENDFSLLVTDINMPILDGLKLIRLVRQDAAYKNLPILVMTTLSTQEDRSRALSLGASAYLVKPAQDDAIVDEVLLLLPDRQNVTKP